MPMSSFLSLARVNNLRSELNPIPFLKIRSSQCLKQHQSGLRFQQSEPLGCPILLDKSRPSNGVKAVLDSLQVDETELGSRNSSLSSSYRNPILPEPNATVLEAQARVCTGPKQTRPLSEEYAFKVLDTILKSAKGELEDEEYVSKAQLGAFFAAMSIRACAFPEETQWSEGERRAMNHYWPQLTRALPPDVIFIADPSGTVMGAGNSTGPQFVGSGTTEMRLVGALREVLAGGHLGYEEVKGVLKDSLQSRLEDGSTNTVSESLISAFLIGQRMNKETDRELKAYCLSFDDEVGPSPVADVKSLTHYGEPYDGNTRFFKSTLFVAAVRSCYGESSLLHGVDWMPPKGGITEEQMLKFMGANTHLSPLQARKLLEDEDVAFAYVSQREVHPSLYSLVGLREHIKKRPPFATSEKIQQIVRASGRQAMIAGFYHDGYEEPLLMLMRRRGVHSGLVVKHVFCIFGGYTIFNTLLIMRAWIDKGICVHIMLCWLKSRFTSRTCSEY